MYGVLSSAVGAMNASEIIFAWLVGLRDFRLAAGFDGSWDGILQVSAAKVDRLRSMQSS